MSWIWRSVDYDFPVEPRGIEYLDEASGRSYSEVKFGDGIAYVPTDELVEIED